MLFNPDERKAALKRVENNDFIDEVFYQCEAGQMDQVATLEIALILVFERMQTAEIVLLAHRLNGITP